MQVLDKIHGLGTGIILGQVGEHGQPVPAGPAHIFSGD
jgi:hypothetical protein